jgi:integrase
VSGRNEAQGVLAVLRFAQHEDVAFAASLLTVVPPTKLRRTRRDLTPAEFDYLLSHVDPRQSRLLELASTLGSRINELFLLERSWVDLERRTIRFPVDATRLA